MPYKKNIKKPTKAQLEFMYNEEGLSQRDIASRFGIGMRTVNRLMKELKIPARSPSQAMLNRDKKKPWIQKKAAITRQRPERTKILRLIRSALVPITRFQVSGASCNMCDSTENLVCHHDPALSNQVKDMLAEGHDALFIAYEITRRHYVGDIKLLVLCSDCHSFSHIS